MELTKVELITSMASLIFSSLALSICILGVQWHSLCRIDRYTLDANTKCMGMV